MKKVNVEDLKIGDKVLKFDRNWLETDFIKHKFVIKDQSTIDKIKSNDIRYVYIEPQSEEIRKIEKIYNSEQETMEEVKETVQENLIDLKELTKVETIYVESIQIVKNVLSEVRAGKIFNTGAVKHVAENIAELTMKNKGVLNSVTKLKQHDDYTFQHSMNVSIFAASLASLLGMNSVEIERVANAGLLHDVGKMLVPADVLNKPGKLTDDEFVIMKSHVQKGYDFLQQQGLDKGMLNLAYEHHERYDGSGYPRGLKDSQISIEGKIGAVVDIYDAITSDRVYHKGMEPPTALKLMFKWADSHINKKVFEFFVMNVGIYPVGSLVLLDTNELAVVGRSNRHKPTEPIVLMFMTKKGEKIPVTLLDLGKGTVKRRKIIGPVNPENIEIPEKVYQYIEKLNPIE